MYSQQEIGVDPLIEIEMYEEDESQDIFFIRSMRTKTLSMSYLGATLDTRPSWFQEDKLKLRA